MLDEPSMGLAPILVDQIFCHHQELHQAGTTILLVEQNAQMALSMAHRGYVRHRKKLAEALRAADPAKRGNRHLPVSRWRNLSGRLPGFLGAACARRSIARGQRPLLRLLLSRQRQRIGRPGEDGAGISEARQGEAILVESAHMGNAGASCR